MKSICILSVCICSFIIITACQEIQPGMGSQDLTTSSAWGKPKDILKIDGYEIWWYEVYGVDTLVWLKKGQVIGQLKASPAENIWSVARAWVVYAQRSDSYRSNLDKYIENILQHHLRIGMVPEEVQLAWGNPKRIDKYPSKYGMRQEWFYERIPYETTRLVFTNDILTEIGK